MYRHIIQLYIYIYIYIYIYTCIDMLYNYIYIYIYMYVYIMQVFVYSPKAALGGLRAADARAWAAGDGGRITYGSP